MIVSNVCGTGSVLFCFLPLSLEERRLRVGCFMEPVPFMPLYGGLHRLYAYQALGAGNLL